MGSPLTMPFTRHITPRPRGAGMGFGFLVGGGA
jgi:hypothetical protein